MKHLNQIFIFITFISFGSCQPQTLDSKTDINQIFSKTEIDDLNRILYFFESKICQTDKKMECYQNFFIDMAKTEETGNFELNIDFRDQKKLYESINAYTFNEIWLYGLALPYPDNPDTMKYITINQNGKYFEFLESLSEDSEKIKNYRETMILAGDISPTTFHDVLMNYKYYDISDIRIRLFIAIHYLTLNDQYERVEKFSA